MKTEKQIREQILELEAEKRLKDFSLTIWMVNLYKKAKALKHAL